jgi:hypothetical protein
MVGGRKEKEERSMGWTTFLFVVSTKKNKEEREL